MRRKKIRFISDQKKNAETVLFLKVYNYKLGIFIGLKRSDLPEKKTFDTGQFIGTNEMKTSSHLSA